MNWRNRKPKYAEFAVGMGMGLCLWLCESWDDGGLRTFTSRLYCLHFTYLLNACRAFKRQDARDAIVDIEIALKGARGQGE